MQPVRCISGVVRRHVSSRSRSRCPEHPCTTADVGRAGLLPRSAAAPGQGTLAETTARYEHTDVPS